MADQLPATVHMIGIGGTGLSAIARVLLESGCRVSGSDRQLSPMAIELRQLGAQVLVGHRAENVDQVDLVIRSSAVPDDNVEVQEALRRSIPVVKRADFLGQLMADRFGIAVAGTHGKTTTTAMLAWMLTDLGQNPSYIIGGVSTNLGTNAHAGAGSTFVIEADEYDRMFLGLHPRFEIITNVEHDHPDCFPTMSEFTQAFVDFTARLEPGGWLLVCCDDQGAKAVGEIAARNGRQVLTYGKDPASDYRVLDLEPGKQGGFTFKLAFRGSEIAKATLQIPGAHNALNAAAALSVAHRLDLPMEAASRSLNAFLGTGRRFEIAGKVSGVTLIDDYAHHPTEIRATLAAARRRFPGQRLWALWQPHTFSRTRILLDAFTTAFEDADEVIVTEIFAARESKPEDGFSASQVAAAIKHDHKHFIPDLEGAARYLVDHLEALDVLLVLSAGDADRVNTRVLKALEERSHAHV